VPKNLPTDTELIALDALKQVGVELSFVELRALQSREAPKPRPGGPYTNLSRAEWYALLHDATYATGFRRHGPFNSVILIPTLDDLTRVEPDRAPLFAQHDSGYAMVTFVGVSLLKNQPSELTFMSGHSDVLNQGGIGADQGECAPLSFDFLWPSGFMHVFSQRDTSLWVEAWSDSAGIFTSPKARR